MTKAPYLVFLVGTNIATFFCFVAVVAAGGGISPEEIMPVIGGLIILSTLAHLMFVYKLWSSLRGGNARMTPGRAIALLFLPIFNVYWIFQVYGGFATDYNNHLLAKGVGGPSLSQALLVLNALLMLVPIPLLNWTVQAMTISKICNAVNIIRPTSA